MNIKEYEGKAIFAELGIPVPRGRIAKTPAEAKRGAAEITESGEVVLKAQVLTGKRGKAGGILFATAKDVTAKAKKILKKKIHGYTVHELLIEEKLEIDRELYVGITIDRHRKCMALICSREGGMDIEEVALHTPEKIITLPLTELALSPEEAFTVAAQLTDDDAQREAIVAIMSALYRVMQEKDAVLVEINPLIITNDGRVIAADSKIVIDDNALFRQEQFRREIDAEEDRTELEKEALKAGMVFVELDGTIGLIGNGAGLTMTMIDLIHHFGGEPANFLDIGGAARTAEMELALDIVLRKKGIRTLCINMFGGITHCDEIAAGIVDYRAHHQIKIPVVVRMVGTNVEQATSMLNRAGITVLDSLEDAVKKAVELT